MQRILTALTVFLATVLAAGVAHAGKELLYVHDGTNSAVHAFEIAGRDGQPTEIPGSPFAVPGGSISCESGSRTMVTDKRRDWLFVSTGTGLALFRRNRDGSLSALGGAPIGPTGELAGLAILEKGKTIWVYAADRGQGLLRIFQIDARTGATQLISTGLTIGTIGGQNGIAVTKKFLYVANRSDGTIHVFSVDKKTGALALVVGSPFAISGIATPSNLLFDKSGKTLVSNDCTQGRYGFARIDTGTGLPRSSTFTNSSSDCTHVFAADKAFKLIYGGGEDGIDLSRGPNQGLALLPTAGPVDDGALNKNGQFLFVISEQNIFVFPIDKKTKEPIGTGTIIVVANAWNGPSTGVVLSK